MKTCKMSVSLSSGNILKKNKTAESSKLENASLQPKQWVVSQCNWVVGVDRVGLSVHGRFVCHCGEFGVVLENLLLHVYFYLAVQLHNFPLE